MSLRLLERLTRARPAGWRLFDAGTGSGILALAAARFGAEEVVAIDNDPTAIATAKENARSNRISGVRFVIGDVKQALRGRFDFITANLYSELLIAMLPKFRQSLARDGRLILSGVLRQQESGLVRSLRANCFRIEESRRRGKWVALVAQTRAKNLVDAKDAQKHLPPPLGGLRFPCTDAVGSVAAARKSHAGRRTFLRHRHAVLDAQIAHRRHHFPTDLAHRTRSRRRHACSRRAKNSSGAMPRRSSPRPTRDIAPPRN